MRSMFNTRYFPSLSSTHVYLPLESANVRKLFLLLDLPHGDKHHFSWHYLLMKLTIHNPFTAFSSTE